MNVAVTLIYGLDEISHYKVEGKVSKEKYLDLSIRRN